MRSVLGLAGPATVAALIAVSLAEAQGRTLVWKSLAVAARLEASAALHVSEQHHMVFDGDWNGGERKFRIHPGQRVELISITRVDPRTRDSRPLSRSTVPAMGVDEYAWSDAATLRWRARRPTDPPFWNYGAIYVLEYRLHDVVFPDGNGYRLDHDFAFAERPGVIERYSLTLDFDPGWKPAPGLTFPLERTNLAPGQTVTLNVPLEWTGEGRPRYIAREAPRAATAHALPAPAAPSQASPVATLPALAAFLALAGLLTYWFVRSEEASGSYRPGPLVTSAWLEENIFRHRADVIGAAWDGHTGEAEAAALIAILAAEGKIENVENVEGTPPRLKLLVPRASLPDYERAFVDRLFVEGDEIDTVALERYYASTGFDPAAAIRSPLDKAAKILVGNKGSFSAGLGCGGGLLVLVLSCAGLVQLNSVPRFPLWAGYLLFFASMILAGLYRSQRKGKLLGAMIPAPLLIMGVRLSAYLTTLDAVVAFLALILLLLAVVLLASRSTGTAEEQETLRALRAAREFFRRRLQQPEADVDERWVPYLLAFGLGEDLDRWSVAAPAPPAAADPPRPTRIDRADTATAPDTGASAPAPSFRAGGGAFGGAGASGGWASSINSFASVVAAPSSDGSSWSPSSSSSSGSSSGGSSGGSSSGGSSRSGGGGGGGW